MSEDCLLVYSASLAFFFIWKTEPGIDGAPDQRGVGLPSQNSAGCDRLAPVECFVVETLYIWVQNVTSVGRTEGLVIDLCS